jgi:hypothetical protein
VKRKKERERMNKRERNEGNTRKMEERETS